jgi:hypothetical protein
MKIYKHRIEGTYHAKLANGELSKGFASKENLLAMLRKLQRNARRYTADQARRDCGLIKTPYGWE